MMQKWVCKDGIYFSGKMKELNETLKQYALQYNTLAEMIRGTMN